MQKHSQHNNDERTHFFRKIYFSHFIRNSCERVTKWLYVRRDLETEQTATYWPPVPLSLAALLSRYAGLLNRGSWGPIALCWVLVLSTASNLQLTDSKLSEPLVAPGYIIVLHPPASCERRICTQFNPSIVKVIHCQYVTRALSLSLPPSLSLALSHTHTHTHTQIHAYICI